MSTKLMMAAVVALMAGGLTSCAVQRGYPYSATDCRYAAPLPYQWVPNGAGVCEHYDPTRHAHKHYRYHRHGKYPHPASYK